MTNILYGKIQRLINSAQHILLLTDERIDGDTIGSTLGMYHVLKEEGKHVEVYSPSPMESSLAFLPGTHDIQRSETIFEDESIDLVMVFDCSDGAYVKECLPKLPSNPKVIVFDHHETNPRYGDINVIEDNAASTADLVWRFVEASGYSINPQAAQCILTGITTDTNAFSSGNTTVECLEAAHKLSQKGAKLQEIVRNTMMNKSLSTLKLWGIAFERLYEDSEWNAIVTAITKKDIKACNVTETESKAMINFLNTMIEGVDVVVVLRETPDGAVKGSLRSQETDVTNLAKQFGGGGHARAAGFKVPNARLQQKQSGWEIVPA